ncbi:MAG: hypothetical protein C0506_15475 [Anaerolinea sp.]|nr:hypothetical protein [Anaerolinea sp.]
MAAAFPPAPPAPVPAAPVPAAPTVPAAVPPPAPLPSIFNVQPAARLTLRAKMKAGLVATVTTAEFVMFSSS